MSKNKKDIQIESLNDYIDYQKQDIMRTREYYENIVKGDD